MVTPGAHISGGNLNRVCWIRVEYASVALERTRCFLNQQTIAFRQAISYYPLCPPRFQ